MRAGALQAGARLKLIWPPVMAPPMVKQVERGELNVTGPNLPGSAGVRTKRRMSRFARPPGGRASEDAQPPPQPRRPPLCRYTSVSLAGQRKVSRVVRVVFSYVGTAPVRHDFGRPPPARMDGHRVVSRCLHVGGVPCECVVGQGASWSFVRAGPPRLLRPPVRPKTGGAP